MEGLDSLTPEQLEQYKANLKFKIKVKTKNDTSLKEEEITLTAFAKEVMEMKIVEVTVIPIEKINTFILLWKELIREVSTKSRKMVVK